LLQRGRVKERGGERENGPIKKIKIKNLGEEKNVPSS
jgi:hypothetical protein